jgi:nucleotide-binding universal stress UspA family protein
MYQNILVTTGGSPWSEAAVAYAIAIAAHAGATLHILTVLTNPGIYIYPDVMGGSEFVADVIEQEAQDLLMHAAERAQQAGVACETLWRWGSIVETILQIATESPYDLIVIGAHMVTGWKRLRLGHIANAIAAKAAPPVLVVKQPPAAGLQMPLGRRILVATGGSPWSDTAVEYALDLAQAQHFHVCLLHVLPGRRPDATAEAEGRRILQRAKAQALAAGVEATTVMASGEVASAIVNTAAQASCDAIIVGSRGFGGWKRLMVGSVSNAVAVKTPLPVLIVKRFLQV